LKNSALSGISANKTGNDPFQSHLEDENPLNKMVCPMVKVDAKEPLLHEIYFSGQPMLNGKTRTCFSCEIWAMIDPSIGFTYLSTENQSPCTVNYSPSAIGKTVAYRLRWIDNLGNCGPWSEIYNQTIE
jgi:hypothetical protein